VKSQLITNQKDNTILHCQVELEGRKSDLKVFKETDVKIHPKVKVKADLGYQGIDKIHANSKVPHKKPKNGELTKKQKNQNKRFRKKRVRIEHVNRKCKCFRMVKETFRNRLKNVAQVWLIVCGLVNLNL
jgi:DDE superfamily endonuclease